jgi:hypothetical protein
VRQQSTPRHLSLLIALGVDYATHQRDQFGAHLLPHSSANALATAATAWIASCANCPAKLRHDVPHTPLALYLSQRLLQKGAETLEAITRHAAPVVPVQAGLAGSLKEALPGHRRIFPLDNDRRPQQPGDTIGEQQHHC